MMPDLFANFLSLEIFYLLIALCVALLGASGLRWGTNIGAVQLPSGPVVLCLHLLSICLSILVFPIMLPLGLLLAAIICLSAIYLLLRQPETAITASIFICAVMCGYVLIRQAIYWEANDIVLTTYIGLTLVFGWALIVVPSLNEIAAVILARKAARFDLVAIGVCLLLVVLFAHSNLSHTFSTMVGAHHWSAYLGFAQLQKAGYQAIQDFPSQYGTGYVWLLSLLGCQTDCWSSTAIYFLFSDLIWVFGLFGLAAAASGSRRTLVLGVLAALLVAAFLIFTAFPESLIHPLDAPSSRERFAVAICASLIAGYVVQSNRSKIVKSLALLTIVAPTLLWAGHTLIFLTPVIALISMYIFKDTSVLIRIILGAILTLSAIALSFLVYFCYVYVFLDDTILFLDPFYFINTNSTTVNELPAGKYTVYYFIFLAMLSISFIFKAQLRLNIFSQILAIISIVSFVYWIGVPHPNNFFNIIIFPLLFIFSIFELSRSSFARAGAAGLLLGLFSLAFSSNGFPNHLSGGGVVISPLTFSGTGGLGYQEPDQTRLIANDRYRLLHRILSNVVGDDPFFLVDPIGTVGDVDDVVLPLPSVAIPRMAPEDIRMIIETKLDPEIGEFWMLYRNNFNEGKSQYTLTIEMMLNHHQRLSAKRNQVWTAVKLRRVGFSQ